MEALLAEYKAANASLEKDVASLMKDSGAMSGRGREQWDLLIKQATEVQNVNTELEQSKHPTLSACTWTNTLLSALREVQSSAEKHAEKVEELEQTLFELQGEIGGGRHVPPGVRVLSLRENPAQAWADTRMEVLDRLKGENDALLGRVKELEEGGARSAVGSEAAENLVPRASWDALRKEKDELEETVKQKEKRLLRLQQVCFPPSLRLMKSVANAAFRCSRRRAPSSETR